MASGQELRLHGSSNGRSVEVHAMLVLNASISAPCWGAMAHAIGRFENLSPALGARGDVPGTLSRSERVRALWLW